MSISLRRARAARCRCSVDADRGHRRHRRAVRSSPGCAEIEAHTRKRRSSRVLANPLDIAALHGRVLHAGRARCARRRRPARRAGGASFEQLVELGKSNRQLDANDQGVVQVVDWLWQYAFDQRASDIHLEPRREQGVIRFRIDGVLHTGLPDAARRDERDDRAHQAARPHGRGREAPPAGRPHQDRATARRRRGRDAPVDPAHRLRREDGDAHLRSRHRGEATSTRSASRAHDAAALGAADHASRTASSWSPGRPARARRPRSTRRSSGWPPTRSTSAPSRTRSR